MSDASRGPKFLIDKVLPNRQVHLLGGPSGGGKTTWWFQTSNDWKNGRPVLGHASHPVPWVYVSTDRNTEGVEDVLDRLHIPHKEVPYCSTLGEDADSLEDHIRAGLKIVPDAKLFVIEGMSGLAPQSTHSDGGYKAIRRWLGKANKFCTQGDCCILGIVHSTKTKEDARFLDPRQRIMGSVAWGAYTDTIIMCETDYADKTGNSRILTVMPRNSAMITQRLVFNTDGRLVEADADLEFAFVNLFLERLKDGEVFDTADFVKGVGGAMSETTAKRRLAEIMADGVVTKVTHGKYRKNRLC